MRLAIAAVEPMDRSSAPAGTGERRDDLRDDRALPKSSHGPLPWGGDHRRDSRPGRVGHPPDKTTGWHAWRVVCRRCALSNHWRTDTCGSPSSTRDAARSAMRRPPQLTSDRIQNSARTAPNTAARAATATSSALSRGPARRFRSSGTLPLSRMRRGHGSTRQVMSVLIIDQNVHSLTK